MIEVGGISFREFLMSEPLPLATIHSAILEFLRHREDAVLYGALAVNAYVDQPRMTQDADIASTRGLEFTEELRAYLAQRFHIAVRIRDVREGLGYRLYQVRKEGDRHVADVRPVSSLPPWELVGARPGGSTRGGDRRESAVLRRAGGQAKGLYRPPGPGGDAAHVSGAEGGDRRSQGASGSDGSGAGGARGVDRHRPSGNLPEDEDVEY
jgi:hypothetical protein